MFSPYDIPNARIEGYDVLVNKPKTAAYRAPGAPAAAFAVETMIDEFCEALGMDPVAFRLLNASKEGATSVTGVPSLKLGFEEVLVAAKEISHYREPLTGPNRGRGVAGGFWFNGSGPAAATLSVLPDGPEREALFLEAKKIAVAYMPYKPTVHRISTDMWYPWLIGYRRPQFWSEWWHLVDVDVAMREAAQR